jgi:nickel-type superoxide dismutase maturation protease
MLVLARFKIIGHSMEPQIEDGQSVLVSSIPYWFKKPQINDIVAVNADNGSKILIKRITKIQNGNYFIEGDNKEDSLDSRKFGVISKDKIIGEVIYNL